MSGGEIGPNASEAEATLAARTFLRRLEGRYRTRDALLFGSRARGDHSADSDADLAVILEGQPGRRYAVASDMAEIAYDVMVETGIYLSVLPLWASELDRRDCFSNPSLIDNIERDGVRL